MNDFTMYGLASKIDEIKKDSIHHIIIPDLITPFSRAKSTVASLIAFLNGLLEEGIAEIKTGAITIMEENVRCGLIGCIAQEDFKKRRSMLDSVGFISRMIPISWKYDRITIVDILDNMVRTGTKEFQEIMVDLPEKDSPIEENREVNDRIKSHCLAIDQTSKVLRKQRQFQDLLKGSALMNHRDKVTMEDLENIKDIMRHINLDYKAI